MDMLRAEDLWVEKRVKSRRLVLLKGIDLEIPSEQFTVLLGESGSGKTILARALAGLLPDGLVVSRGRISFGRRVMSGPADWARVRGRKVFYVPQNAAASFNPVLTIGRQIRETSRIGPGELEEMIARLQFSDPARVLHSYPFALSGGENQRCLLALALAARPEVLILDEPTAEIDAVAQKEFISVLRDYQRAFALTVLLISHHLGFVMDIAQKIYVLSGGEVIAAGAAQDVFRSPGHAYTREIAEYLGAN